MTNRELIKTLKDGNKISFMYRRKEHFGVVLKRNFDGCMRAVVYGENEYRTRINIALTTAQKIKLLD